MQTRSALALLFLNVACATATRPTSGAPDRLVATPLAEEPRPCDASGLGGARLPPDVSVSFVVRATACGARLSPAEDPSRRWFVRRHHELDENGANGLVVAAMIVACVADGSCDASRDPESFGLVQAWAWGFTPEAIEPELAKRVTPEVAAAFRVRVRESVAFLDEQARRLDDRRRALYVDLPRRIRSERVAHAAALAGFDTKAGAQLREIDAALGDLSTVERLQELSRETRRLREAALLQCSAKRPLRDCLDGPVLRPLTRALVRLAIELGDAPQAAAEQEQLALGSDQSTFALHVGAELRRAFDEHQATVARYEAARRDGTMSEVLLGAAFGTPPPQPLPALAWVEALAPSDLRPQIAALGATERVEGIVRGSRGRGGALEIAFDPARNAPSARPVLLEVSEARLLRVGEKLEAIVDTQSRRGVVLFAYRTRPAEQVVQVRGTRLGR